MGMYELGRSNYKDIEGFFRVKFDFPNDTFGDGSVLVVLSIVSPKTLLY